MAQESPERDDAGPAPREHVLHGRSDELVHGLRSEEPTQAPDEPIAGGVSHVGSQEVADVSRRAGQDQ